MKMQKQSCGALMGMAAVLVMTSAVAAQFQGSSAQSDVSGPPASSAGVVAGSVDFKGDNGALASAWIDLGYAFAGVAGDPKLSGSGAISAGLSAKITLSNAAPLAMAVLFVAVDIQPTRVPFKGATTVVPAPTLQLVVFTDEKGGFELSVPAAAGIPAGHDLVMQYAIADAAAAQGVAMSNALQTTTH